MSAEPNASKAGFKLVRWLSIVALGCCLAFLLSLFITYLRPVDRRITFGEIVITGPEGHHEFKQTSVALEKELQKVISSQLSAFRQDDYSQAYSFAATTVKASVSLPSFEKMVKAAYPVIAQSRSAQFGNILDDGQIAMVNVTIAGSSGETRRYQYFLQRENSGWKISGVREVKPSGVLI